MMNMTAVYYKCISYISTYISSYISAAFAL